MGRKSRDSVSGKITFPAWHGNMLRRESYQYGASPKKQKSQHPIRDPNPWDLHQTDRPPKCVAQKANGAHVQGPKMTQETVYRAHVHSHLSQDPVSKKKKAEVLKVSRDYYVKEIDLLIQKHMLEEQRTAKTLPGDGGIGGQYYCTSELPCQHRNACGKALQSFVLLPSVMALIKLRNKFIEFQYLKVWLCITKSVPNTDKFVITTTSQHPTVNWNIYLCRLDYFFKCLPTPLMLDLDT